MPDLSESEIPEQKMSIFKISKIKDDEDNITSFRVSGQTYDIKSQLKLFNSATFNAEKRCWQYVYDSALYEEVVGFLKSLSDNIVEDVERDEAVSKTYDYFVQEDSYEEKTFKKTKMTNNP
jgi:hypothetical protein